MFIAPSPSPKSRFGRRNVNLIDTRVFHLPPLRTDFGLAAKIRRDYFDDHLSLIRVMPAVGRGYRNKYLKRVKGN